MICEKPIATSAEGYCRLKTLERTATFTVRVFASTVTEAAEELSRVRRALVSDGDLGLIGDADNLLLVRETSEGASSGYVRGAQVYFIQAGFTISGRV